MAIELFVEDISTVDEGLREEYVQGEDGRYVLRGMAESLQDYVKVDEIEKHERTQGLVSALEKEREGRREAERKARDIEAKAHEISDEEKKELEALRAARADAEEKRRRAEGEFDKWRDEIQSKHQGEVKDIVAERDELKSYVCDMTVNSEIAEACAEFGGRVKFIEPLVRRQVQAAFEEGTVSTSVMDADGTRLLDDNGAPLSIRGYIERMASDKEYGDLFASKMKSGGGSSSEEGAAGGAAPGPGETPPNLKRSEMTKSEKVAFIREHGNEAFHELPL